MPTRGPPQSPDRNVTAMQLYYSPLSPNSRRVRILAALLGLDLELVNVDLLRAEHRKPPYLAINPMGKVPVLVEGDFILPESAAIMIHLADAHAGDALYPTEPEGRAQVNRWLFWAAAHWGPAASALAFEKVLKPRFFKAGEPDQVQVQRQEQLIRDFAKILDDQLSRHEWVSGQTITLADIAIAPSLRTPGAARRRLTRRLMMRPQFNKLSLAH
jgi:glutathione S-transferase